MAECASSEQWLSIVAQAWEQADDSEALVELISAKLSGVAGERKPMVTALAAGMAELVQYAKSPSEAGWTAVDEEREAVEMSRRVVRPLYEARLQRRLDELDERGSGRSVCAGCQEVARSQGRRRRGWASLLGPLSLRRRYAHCAKCERGVAPAQHALGLPEARFTPRLAEVVTMVASTVPHEMACTLVSKMCGVSLSKKAVEDLVEQRGGQVLEQLEQDAKQWAAYDETGLPKPATDAVPSEPQMQPATETDVAYIEMDGVIPVTREQIAWSDLSAKQRKQLEQAKQDKARGGKGRRYTIVGREVKNAVLYTAADCAQESPQRGCLLRKRYVSLLGTWTAFAAMLWVELARLRFERAKLVVILSDGAEWIRSLAAWLPFETLLILDLYHVKHRILEVAQLLWGKGSAPAQAWAHAQYTRIESDQALMVIDALRFVDPPTQAAADKVEELRDLPAQQPRPDALLGLPRAWPTHFVRSRRKRQLPRHRPAAQMPGHEVGRTRRPPHGRPACRPLQRPMGGPNPPAPGRVATA